jgi:hypothetical protein
MPWPRLMKIALLALQSQRWKRRNEKRITGQLSSR